MNKVLLALVPAAVAALSACSGEPVQSCTVDMDTRESFDGQTVELTVSTAAKPGRAGYGRLQTNDSTDWLSVKLPYAGEGITAAKLTDGRVLYLSCRPAD